MLMVANWLSDNLWVELTFGACGGFALAAILLYFQYRAGEANQIQRDEQRLAHERRHQFQLLCADAKVMTDLAMQRYMSDAQFLQCMRAQPCFAALFPYFSEEFRALLNQEPGDHANKAFLAVACHAELTRLEATPDSIMRAPLERFDHRNTPVSADRLTFEIERDVEVEVLPKAHHEVQKT